MEAYIIFAKMIVMDKQTIINRLEALDLSQYPYYEIRELIRELGRVGFIIMTLHPGKSITRARPEGSLEKNSDLSYKPQQYNQKCQRASTPNQTMFYGCVVPEEQSLTDTRFISACECSSLIRGGTGTSGVETITYGRWEVTEDINLIVIVHKDYFQEANNSLLAELKFEYEQFLQGHPDLAGDLDISTKFFAKEFAKKNETGEDWNYLISAVFTEVATMEHAFDGVMYPSVQADGQLGFNVAITPDAVDKKMRLTLAYEVQLTKEGEEVYIGKKGRRGIVLPDSTIVYEDI